VGKNAKSHTAERAPGDIGAEDLFKMMSELISLRERVAQAELADLHSRSLGKLPAAIDRAKAGSKPK
jgi:hypothetical protein